MKVCLVGKSSIVSFTILFTEANHCLFPDLAELSLQVRVKEYSTSQRGSEEAHSPRLAYILGQS